MSGHSWLPLDVVTDHIGVTGDTELADAVERARSAAAAYVERARPDLWDRTVDPAEYLATDDIVEGAMLYAARLHSRKGSPAGIASFGEFSATLPRLDPDIERLLGLGRHAKPVIG